LHACWAVFGHIRWHPLDELAGAAIAALLGVAAVRACLFVRRGLRAQRRVHQAHLLVWLSFTRPQNDGVLWLEHDKPFAYSVPGRPSLIVASTALNLLPAGYRDAVLHHERHHLRRRHHLLVIGARAIRHALVPLPLFIRLPAQVESLTELAADKHASQQCGLDAVRGALAAIGPATAAGSRLRHLAEPVPAQRLKRREFFHRATATLPALSATALSLLAALTC